MGHSSLGWLATAIVLWADADDNSARKSVSTEPAMPTRENSFTRVLAHVLAPADSTDASIPVWLARDRAWLSDAPLSAQQKTWVEAQGTKPAAGYRHVLLPGTDGRLAD